MSVRDCIPLFPADEVPAVLNMLLDAAVTLRKLNGTETEDDLSDRLFKRLRNDRRLRASPFSIHREARVYDDVIDQAGHMGRVDLCCMCPGGDQTYFAIEAKRLHVIFPSGWASLVSEYVSGDQGMMCFVTGKYAETQQKGAMLGYVFDGDVRRARSGITKSIDKNKNKLRIVGESGLVRSDIVKRRQRVDETCHLLGKRPFTLYHILVPV